MGVWCGYRGVARVVKGGGVKAGEWGGGGGYAVEKVRRWGWGGGVSTVGDTKLRVGIGCWCG